MKKTFTYLMLGALVFLLFTGCVKEKVADDRSYWLSQESGAVVYSNNFCGFYVVETNYGYTIIQNLDGSRIYEADVLYGNFGGYGTRDFYNYTAGVISRSSVLASDLSYDEAADAIDYYCPAGKAGGSKIRQSATSLNKIPRATIPTKK